MADGLYVFLALVVNLISIFFVVYAATKIVGWIYEQIALQSEFKKVEKNKEMVLDLLPREKKS